MIRRGDHRPARSRGTSLIEAMICVVVIGVVAITLSTTRLHGPRTPGGQALRLEEATELLVQAQQEALATPFDQLAREAEGLAGPPERRVERVGPGLLRITLEASWGRQGARERTRVTMVTLRGDGR